MMTATITSCDGIVGVVCEAETKPLHGYTPSDDLVVDDNRFHDGNVASMNLMPMQIVATVTSRASDT